MDWIARNMEGSLGMIVCRSLRVFGKLKGASLVVLGILAVAQLAAGQAAAGKDTAAATFKANCEVCHGADGSGSDLGHRLHVKDLRSKEVQATSTAVLMQTIRAGKNNMPAFGNRLGDDQIKGLVVFVRHKNAGSH